MGKKIASLMAEERVNFVNGATAKGYDENVAGEIFDLIEPFAGYAFNKAHSVSYGLISYWTAYFKNHYPVEYMAAVLNSRLDNPEKTLASMNECFRLKIPILLPNINRSEEYFCIDHETSDQRSDGPEEEALSGPGLRIGLAAIKSVGESAVRPLVADRKKNGQYKSIDDFSRRTGATGLNRRTLESLAKAGAFDSLSPRGAVIQALDQITATAQREARTRDSGQSSMFDGNEAISESAGMSGITLDAPDASDQEKAAWERELLGMTLSHNPLIALAAMNIDGVFTSLDRMTEDPSGQPINVLGFISSIIERNTREGKRFFIVNLEVMGGILEVMVWPDTLLRTTEVWQDGRLVMITGRLRTRGDQTSLSCDSAIEFDPENPFMPPPAPISPRNGYSGNGNGNGSGIAKNNKSDGKKTTDNNISEKKAQMTSSYNTSEEPQKVVRLAVTESADPSHDAHLLREVIGVLLEYPGRDRVNLDIRTGERLVRMDLPVVSTSYSEGLHSRLEELLGSDTVSVHQKLDLGMDPLEESPPSTMALESTSEQKPKPAPLVTDLPFTEDSLMKPEESQVTVPPNIGVSATVGTGDTKDEPPF